MSPDDGISAAKPTFAALLKGHRVAAALSQEALAERSGLSLRAISDLERGVKTRPHLETVGMLADGLELDKEARAQFIAAARPIQAPAATRAAPQPSAHQLIGRDNEVAAAIKLLAEDRVPLLTLTGPGGVGKTSLARAITGELAQPAIWVDLMPLSNPTLVPAAVAQAAGVPEDPRQTVEESLRAFLLDKRLLIVLDNCEHLRAAVAGLVGDLLPRCPQVQVLATSRSRLRLSAERIFPVEPLALPDAAASKAEEVANSESVALFVARARKAQADFSVDQQNAADVAAICRRLDGLPLAIELAAARIRLLSPSTLRALLEERFRVLTGGYEDAPAHHRTLEAALAWSYDLLDPQAQATFQALAAFAGGCTFEATCAVAQSDPFAIADDLQELLDQNLIGTAIGPDGDTRYTMLDTMRDFGRARLLESGEEEAVRDRHATYFLNQAEQADAELTGPRQSIWMRRLDADRDNLRGALAWLGAKNAEADLLRLSSALWSYWSRRGLWDEGRAWLERAAVAREGDTSLRARACHRLGNLAIDLSNYSRAKEMYDAALALSRDCGDRRIEADALNGLGIAAGDTGALAEARQRHLEALTIRSEIGDIAGQARSNFNLGILALATEDTPTARLHLEKSFAAYESNGNSAGAAYSTIWLAVADMMDGSLETAEDRLRASLTTLSEPRDELGLGFALTELGHLAHLQGDCRGALSFLREALQIRSALGDHLGLISTLEQLAGPVAALGQTAAAMQLLGAAAAKRDVLGTPATPAEQHHIDQVKRACAMRIGDDRMSDAFEEGLFLSERDALALVYSIRNGGAANASPSANLTDAC